MNTINARTPEEIKKLLECCYGNKERRLCEKCPSAVKVEGYSELICTDFDASGESALAYIQQLERERDAAVNDMTELMQLGMFCCYCKHLTDDGECTKDYNGIDTKNLGKPGGWWCWQWRGVQEVE